MNKVQGRPADERMQPNGLPDYSQAARGIPAIRKPERLEWI
jgi:hypothetical protein